MAAERAGLAAALGPDLTRLDRAIEAGGGVGAGVEAGGAGDLGPDGGAGLARVGWERRTVPLRRRLAQAETLALEFVAKPLDRWVKEGRMEASEAEAIRGRLGEDATRLGVRHLGMAVAVSVPLRFPFGSLTRFAMVVSFRLRARSQYRAGEMDAASYRMARETHTWPVALVALIPGFGAGAYLLSPTLRRSGNLLPLVVDGTLYQAPFGLYRRLRLGRLVPTRLPRFWAPRLRLPEAAVELARSPFAPAQWPFQPGPVARIGAPADESDFAA